MIPLSSQMVTAAGNSSVQFGMVILCPVFHMIADIFINKKGEMESPIAGKII
jgi:hypothetical protein